MSKSSLENFVNQPYKYGFATNIKTEKIKKGLNSQIIYLISEKKKEPNFMYQFRLKALERWKKMLEPEWAYLNYKKPNYQNICYYSAPNKKKTLTDVDPELLSTFDKLEVSISEKKTLRNVAIDLVFDSISLGTTFKNILAKSGVIFCSISEAIQIYPELIKVYIGSVIPSGDNFFTALNSATFTDGSFCYIPKNIKCPIELSTYFRINDKESGQFERTLIIAEDNSEINYLEGCTAPQYDTNQLHAAIVELVALNHAQIKYSTVQNWYAGDTFGTGGIYNFVTKRGLCVGFNSRISWTQVETGSAITWKYPSCILSGNASKGEFYSVALTKNYQQADTGTKMVHLGKNTRSTIISKGISAGKSQNSYRGLVQVGARAENARNFSQCDSLLMGNECGAHTFPYIEAKSNSAQIEHEATTSKIGEDQIFYCNQRGIDTEKAIALIVNGFSKEVLNKLPMEFAVEAQKLLEISLEGSVG